MRIELSKGTQKISEMFCSDNILLQTLDFTVHNELCKMSVSYNLPIENRFDVFNLKIAPQTRPASQRESVEKEDSELIKSLPLHFPP